MRKSDYRWTDDSVYVTVTEKATFSPSKYTKTQTLPR